MVVGAVKQLYAKLLFQIADDTGQALLGDVARFGGKADRADVRHLNEVAQIFHSHSGSPSL